MVKSDFARRLNTAPNIRLIRLNKAANMLGVSESTVRRMIKQGRIPEPLRTEHGNISGWISESFFSWVREN